MDQAIVSAVAALGGSLIGGLTSFLTAWSTQHAQARITRFTAERTKRELLYSEFLDEFARLYQHAVTEDVVDYGNAVKIYSLIGRVTLVGQPETVASAHRAVSRLLDLYFAPSKSPEEIRAMVAEMGTDPMHEFAQACRTELDELEFGPRRR